MLSLWNLIVVCHDWCTLSFTGLTSQNESSTSSVYSCTDANTTKLLGTWRTTVHQFLTSFTQLFRQHLRSASSHQLSVPRYWLSTYGLGRFLLLARLSGPHCPKTFGIQSVVLTLTDSRWRHFYFRSTSVFSALEVFYVNALYKFTFDIDIVTRFCVFLLLYRVAIVNEMLMVMPAHKSAYDVSSRHFCCS